MLEDKRLNTTEFRLALSRTNFRRSVVMKSESIEGNRGDDDRQSEDASAYNSVKLRENPQPGFSPSDENPAGVVQVPKLKFTSSSDPDGITIEPSGAQVRRRPDRRECHTWVRTDGRMVTGLQYWVVEIARFSPSRSEQLHWTGSAGVTQESKFSYVPGPDDKSWLVNIYYDSELNCTDFRFVHRFTLHSETNLTKRVENQGTIRFGFLLQATDRTLTVVDVSRDTRLFTFTDVDLSQALVPVVGFGLKEVQTTFRLPIVNSSRLPKIVRAMLKI